MYKISKLSIKRIYLPIAIIVLLIFGGVYFIPKFLGDTTDLASTEKTKTWSGNSLGEFALDRTEVVNNTIGSASLGYNSTCSEYVASAVWGSRGEGSGQFGSARSIIIKNDSIYVLDQSLNRIQKFDLNGTLQNWNLSQSPDYPLSGPQAFAIDSNGYFYLTDTNNHRIQVFDSTGVFRRQFGTLGSGDNNFSYPQGIALDTSNNIYVADSGNDRIMKFSSLGVFISKWGSTGNQDGQFGTPSSISVDPNGSVYVADTYNQRVQKFSLNGTFLQKWGKEGVNAGEFSLPTGVNAIGNFVYVADTQNHRVPKFDRNGVFISSTGTGGLGLGNLDRPAGTAVDSTGKLYVVDTGNFRVEKFKYSVCYASNIAVGGSANGQVSTPLGLAMDINKNIYLADSGNNRLQKFDSLGNYSNAWSGPSGGVPFSSIAGVAVSRANEIYSVDSATNRMQIMDSSGESVYSTSQLSGPLGVSVDLSGNAYIADTGNNRIRKITKAGGIIGDWGTLGTGDAQFNRPSAIYVDIANACFYVVDTGNNRIQKFALNGNFVAKWGTAGSGEGQFTAPSAVSTDSDGNVYIADTGNKRIQIFKSDGTFIQQFGMTELTAPTGIVVSSDGDVFIADADNTIKKYASSQRFQTSGTAKISSYDSGMDGSIWKKVSWVETGRPAGSTVKVRIRTSDTKDLLSSATWSNYVEVSADKLLMPDKSIPYGRYADIEAYFAVTDSSAAVALSHLSVTYGDFVSGNVYGDNQVSVGTGIKVIIAVNNRIVGTTATDKNGRYHFGSFGMKPNDNIKVYLESVNYAGAASIIAGSKENLSLNIYGRTLVVNPTEPPVTNGNGNTNGTTPPIINPPVVTPPQGGDSNGVVSANTNLTKLYPIYRFYNKSKSRHFYTLSEVEKGYVDKMSKWRYEGNIGYAYLTQVAGTYPVYRLYDSKNERHFYTISDYEKNAVLSQSKLFRLEGIAFFAFPQDAPGHYEMYRFWDRTHRAHFYTISRPERDKLKRSWLWKLEGIAFKVEPSGN